MKSIKISKVKMIILCFLGILIIATIVLGLSMAYIKPVSNPEETNISLKTCAKISFKENSKSINLENTYPMDEEIALEKVKPYEFSINSTCDGYFNFNLYLTSLNTNEIEDQNIHYAITDINKEILTEGILSKEKDGINDFNTEELKELDKGLRESHKTIYKIYNNIIPLNEESKYQLYLWLDKDAENETMGKTFQAGVSVKANKREETLAEYLIKNKDNTLIYHDGLPDYEGMENSDLEAGDLSYRYMGISNIVNNYVCLDGTTTTGSCASENDLYRIIGLFKNNLGLYEIKLIKVIPYEDENVVESIYTESGKGYYWSGSKTNSKNIWQDSTLNSKILNEKFFNSLSPTIRQKIVNHDWVVEGNTYENIIKSQVYQIYQNEILNKNNISKAKIGLLYVSDFGFSIDSWQWNKQINEVQNDKSWLFLGDYEWTITRRIRSDYSSFAFFVDRNQYFPESYGNISIEAFNIRPVFYLNYDVNYAYGDGRQKNPYRI